MNILGKLKHKRKLKGKDKYFIKNGGDLLKELISSTYGKINPIRMFTIEELNKATNHFSSNMLVGTCIECYVYRGIHDGQLLAIMRYNRYSEEGNQNPKIWFINEMVSLSQSNHRNIQKLIGCCIESDYPMLVVKLLPNGSLFDRLSMVGTSTQLQWASRLRIAIDIADALAYLHTALRLPITHGKVKSNSVVLDNCLTGKLCNFMHSEMQNDPTRCEIYIGMDIHDFGDLLLELIIGKSSLSPWRDSYYTWDDILNIAAKDIKEEDVSQVKACYELAKRCFFALDERPRMKAIVQELRKISTSDASDLGRPSHLSQPSSSPPPEPLLQ